jgi:DNA-binding transcriptional MerR regulator
MEPTLPEYLTITEVAERYRTTVATVRTWRKSGSYGPRGVKVGTRVLYSASEIKRFDEELAAQVQGTA